MARGQLLNDLFSKDEAWKILIQDSADVSGIHLLKCHLCRSARLYDTVHIVLTDHPPVYWTKGLPSDITHKLKTHFLTVKEWKQSIERLTDWILFLPHEHESMLLIDNISTLLLHLDCAEVCRLLHVAGSYYKVLCCLMHRDLHYDQVIDTLSHVMSSVITLSLDGNSQLTSCSITHKQNSGKVIRKIEYFEVLENYRLKVVGVKSDEESRLESVSSDPMGNLTFDLKLTEREKQDRAQVILPYTQKIGTGNITYEPDENDDFDDSDPDDDLNI